MVENLSNFLFGRAYFCFADEYYALLALRSDEYWRVVRAHVEAIEGSFDGDEFVEGHSTDIRLCDSGNSNATATIYALSQKDHLVTGAATPGETVRLVLVDAVERSVLMRAGWETGSRRPRLQRP